MKASFGLLIQEVRFMLKRERNDDAFTGLEAAIVLIAFVVVAAVFSYVVLGAGFFTTQKSQEVVHTGVGQASSALELSGPVTVQANATGTALETVDFYMQLAAGGTPVDLTKVTYTVSTTSELATYIDEDEVAETLNITRVFVGSGDSDDLLENSEMVLITINLEDGGFEIGPNGKFLVEVKPHQGASLPISRTAPAGMTADGYYEVF
jgi:archaeal flagellin FlaB